MGNFFSKKKEQELVEELIRLSNGTLQEDRIYAIIMNSNCKDYIVAAQELIELYKIFCELDTRAKSFISNQQLLNLAEFRYHPLRSRLKFALQTKHEEYIDTISRSVGIKGAETGIRPIRPGSGKSRIMPESVADSIEDDLKVDDSFLTEADRLPYIDFQLFSTYMTPFCQRTPIDIKVTFLFKLFDFDQDGAINREDLKQALSLMVRNHMTVNEIEEVIAVIFAEIGQEKDSIDKDDFQKVLWVTDFDQKLNFDRISR